MAVEVIKVVDPDSGTGFDYVSLASWDSGEAKDLVTADEKATAKCRCTGGTADSTMLTLSASWVTSNSCNVKLWTDSTESYRHNGTYQTGNKYRMERAGSLISNLNVEYLRIIGLQLQITVSSGSPKYIYNSNASGWLYLEKTVLRGVFSGTASVCLGLDHRTGGTAYISNCIAYDFTNGTGAHKAFQFHSGDYVYCYNNTVQNCNVGYRSLLTPDVSIKNCLAQDCSDGFSGAPDTAINNCSDIVGDAPGTNPQTGEVLFVDENANDFHLDNADTVANDNGTDLYNDPNYRITDDIDSEARYSPWDIGADHVVAVAAEPKTKIFYNWGG